MPKVFKHILAYRQALQRKRYEENLVRSSNAIGTTYKLASKLPDKSLSELEIKESTAKDSRFDY